ncbi:MAG: hypothetical protein ACKKMV_03730 [Candidatus Nealsonbacteria bacterium]|nr:MAG: hypothetical protein IB617_01890 [Candidatus Nealsonbacteria bacterium]
MSYKTIFEIILFGSSIGLGIIIVRKIPVLSTLPETAVKKESLTPILIEKIRKLNPFKNFSYEKSLQEILTKVRILSLKTDKKTSNWLKKLRENSQRKKIREDDNYWDEIKKATKR